MAKDTSTSKCPGMVSVCDRFGSVICCNKYSTNYGFRLQFDVDLTGFSLSDSQIKHVSSIASKVIKAFVNQCIVDKLCSCDQKEFVF